MGFNRLAMVVAGVALGMMLSQVAEALTITGGFSGSWYDPATSGQGFNLEVTDGATGSQVVAYWYGFDAQGGQTWAVGVGDVQGSSATIKLMRPDGLLKGGFTEFADVTIGFDDCDNGDATFGDGSEQVGTGFMELVRITGVEGSDCTGGISDNFEDGDGELEISVPLFDTGVFPGAGGHADFEQHIDRTEFKVEIEDLPDGVYDLFVGGEFKGMLEVVGGMEAEIGFRSPMEDGKLLLDFDPRGQAIDVELDGVVVLTADLPADALPGDDDDDDDGAVTDLAGLGEYEVGLINTGASDAGEGEAKLEIRSDHVEFQVEVQNLPPGSYDLLVGGEPKGIFEVTGTEEVELEYRDPVEDGKLPLDFDPRGQLVEVAMADVVYLFADFPVDPTEAIDDDDDDGAGDVDDDDVDDGDDDDDGLDDGDDDDDDDGLDDGDDDDDDDDDDDL